MARSVEQRLALLLSQAKPLGGGQAVDLALDDEECIEASDRLQRYRGDRLTLLALPGIFCDVGQLEELSPRMREAKCRHDRQRFLLRIEQRLEAVVAVRLDDSTEPGQMFLWMLTNIGSRYAPNLGKPAKRIAEIAVHRIHNAGGFAELGAPSLLSIGIDKFGACFDVLEKSGEVATKAKRVL